MIDTMTQEGVVNLTPVAAYKIRDLLEAKGLPNHGLRVFVQGGGCSGLSYGMAFEDQTEDGDEIIEQDGVRVFVDQISAMYLTGAVIDYTESLMGGGFKIENPQAVSSCGCGHSFRTSSQGAAAGYSAGGGGGGCGCGH
jgi:iron-sulfur cluster assembly accessory protein